MDEPVIELDAEQAALRRRDATWVRECLAGDQHAFGQLYDAWFDRVFNVVDRVVRDRDVAAEVAQEAFFSAWRNLGTLENPDAFGGWLLRIARNGAYNRSQKEQRSYAVDDQGLTVIESVGASPTGAPSGFGVEDRLGRAVTPGAAVEDAEIVSLVWEAAEALPERDVEVLDLQLRHGLTPAEIGDVMGMNRNAANQLVHRLKARLETAIRARVLWRGGAPSCEVLAQRLADLGIDRFSADAVRVTERHVPGCVECDERQRLHLQPAALFAAVPLFAVPLALKQTAAAALAASGVPMGGSAFLGAAGIAGQAVGNVGSIAGGSVNPGIGGNVGHAVSTPGVHPGVGSNVGNAIGGSNPVGGPVGNAVGGPGAPGSGVGNAAGQSMTPPTPIESAASYAAKVAALEHVAESAASMAGPAPMPPPPPMPPGAGGGSDGSGSSARTIFLGVAAAVVVLVLLFAGGLWWGGRDDGSDLIASGAPVTAEGSVPTTAKGAPGSPGTTGADGATTTAPGETTTSSSSPGDPSSPTTPTTNGGNTTPTTTRSTNPNTDPTNPTTQPTTQPTTTTTQPTTTTTFVPSVSITVTPNSGDTNGWIHSSSNPGFPATPRVLSWSVTPSAGYTVEVTGPGATNYPVQGPVPMTPKTTSTGSLNVCPGMLYNTGSFTQCLPALGTHTYTITVKKDGQVVVSKQALLTITQAPIIP